MAVSYTRNEMIINNLYRYENNKKEDPMNGKNPHITKSSSYICV